MKQKIIILMFALLPTMSAFSQQVDPKLGQGDIPAWFTYPQEGEYVGVSPDKIKDPVLKEKAAEMIALLSYVLCQERKGMNETDYLENVKNEQISYSTDSPQNSEYKSVSKIPLELEFSIDYFVSKRHVGNDGSVWVSIKPGKGKNKLILSSNTDTTFGTETKGDEVLNSLKSKNFVNLQYGKSVMSCAWDLSNLQNDQTSLASNNTFALKIEHQGKSEVVGVNENSKTQNLYNSGTWTEKQRKAIEKDALKRMDINSYPRTDVISMCDDKGIMYAHSLVTFLYERNNNPLENYPQLKTSAIYFGTGGDVIALVYNETIKVDEPDYEAMFAQNIGGDTLIHQLGEDISANDTIDEGRTSDTFSDVDVNIPVMDGPNRNSFAVIIGNEKYKNEVNVPYAENDAKIFKLYVQQTLGVPEKQIHYVTNAGLNDLRFAVRWLKQAMEICNGQGKAIFYYAGHGIPDEADKTAYLLPTDGIGSDPETGYSLQKLYSELGKMQAQRAMIFLDACFSGSKRDGQMMVSARGVAIKVKPMSPEGNTVVFSAAQGDETAYPYKEQQHGMFTYYLLRKLQETKGDLTLGELSDYLTNEVKRESFVENHKMQTPTVNSSPALSESWRLMKLK